MKRIRKPTNLTLSPEVIKSGKKKAKKEGISFSQFVERLIKAALIGAIIFSMTHCAPKYGCSATKNMIGYHGR